MSLCKHGNADLASALFSSGTWGGNLEDWTSEDWNEDVRQHFLLDSKGICSTTDNFPNMV